MRYNHDELQLVQERLEKLEKENSENNILIKQLEERDEVLKDKLEDFRKETQRANSEILEVRRALESLNRSSEGYNSNLSDVVRTTNQLEISNQYLKRELDGISKTTSTINKSFIGFIFSIVVLIVSLIFGVILGDLSLTVK